MSDIQETIGENDSGNNGLDSILGCLEETGSLMIQLRKKLGDTHAQTLSRIIQFGIVNKEGYDFLRQQKKGFFQKLFENLDITDAEKDLNIRLSPEEKNGFGVFFEIQVIQTLVNYEIFGYIMTKEFEEKYQLIHKFKIGGIYQDLESGAFFLNIDENYYPESNIVQNHYDSQNEYLYFDGGDIFYIFDIKKGEIVEFEGEFDSVHEVLGKHYLFFESPTQSTIYCVEDTTEVKKNILGAAGFFLKVFDYKNEVFTVSSSQFEYIGFQAGVRGIKTGNSTKIEKIGEKMPFIEQEGVFRELRIFGEKICLITEKRDFYEKDGKFINSFTEIIRFYDQNGYYLENELIIPTHRILKKIETQQDIMYIVEIESGKIDIFSLGSGVALSHISKILPSKIESIKDTKEGVLVHYIYPNGAKGFFPSADYPSIHLH